MFLLQNLLYTLQKPIPSLNYQVSKLQTFIIFTHMLHEIFMTNFPTKLSRKFQKPRQIRSFIERSMLLCARPKQQAIPVFFGG
jgi:hypothetical protein